MATDDERREVAARLRGLDYSDLQESLICAYLDALGIKGYEDWIGIAHRLADLIDPTCLACPDVEDTPDGGQFECWSCSVCGNILSSDPDYDTDEGGPTYCEVCGHRIVGKGKPTWL